MARNRTRPPPDGAPVTALPLERRGKENVLVVTLNRREQPVDIDGERYLLREMTGNELDEWRSTVGNRISVDKSGVQKVTNFDKFTASLIACCLIDPAGKRVDQTVIANWPATAQKRLFEMCQALNGLTLEAEEAEKKD
jgi:hypothetical protein